MSNTENNREKRNGRTLHGTPQGDPRENTAHLTFALPPPRGDVDHHDNRIAGTRRRRYIPRASLVDRYRPHNLTYVLAPLLGIGIGRDRKVVARN